jgi:tryptophan synthase alpha chain
MNRLTQHFELLRAKNEKALILFITAGDPTLKDTSEIMKALAKNGADCIELGMPFSDPIGDGPIIQHSTARALENHIKLDYIFHLVKIFRQEFATPVVLMGYYNPILRYGIERFVFACKESSIDGMIVADLPYEEGEPLEKQCRSQGVHLIYLLAPEPGSERTKAILAASSGFVYCVSHYGTTGVDQKPDERLDDIVTSLRSMTDLPIAVGFGISSAEKAKAACRSADGIIIGSWLIKELENGSSKPAVAADFTRKLKRAIQQDQTAKP